MTTFRKLFLISIVIACNSLSAWSQSINYEEVFGDNWKKAQVFVRENRYWMEPVLKRNNISYPLVIAIIFPELVRYSALRDKMEITLLKALYVNLGQDYANFSIGRFQMKPSFAQIVRQQASMIHGRKYDIVFRDVSEFDDIKDFRKSIVNDLENPESEFNYIIAFIRICEKKYKTARKDEISELKFLATAYNYGLDKTATQIESMTDKKFFNTSLFKTENYCYSEVSLWWYQQYMLSKQ